MTPKRWRQNQNVMRARALGTRALMTRKDFTKGVELDPQCAALGSPASRASRLSRTVLPTPRSPYSTTGLPDLPASMRWRFACHCPIASSRPTRAAGDRPAPGSKGLCTASTGSL